MKRYYIPVNGIVIECDLKMWNSFEDSYVEQHDALTYLVARTLINDDNCYRVVDGRGLTIKLWSFNNVEDAYIKYKELLQSLST